MARYQVILAYDGTHFAGFQRQARSRTVQGVVEAALRQLGWQGRAILSAGRTDTGVHASGQVIAFDLDWPTPKRSWSRRSTQTCRRMWLPGRLHRPARTSTRALTPRPAGIATISFAMRSAIRCASSMPGGSGPQWIWPVLKLRRPHWSARTISPPSVPRPGPEAARCERSTGRAGSAGRRRLVFEVVANAFLYHMVRRLVFLQVQIGQGRLALADFESGICEQASQTPGLAPPQGLVLAEVYYKEPVDRVTGTQEARTPEPVV